MEETIWPCLWVRNVFYSDAQFIYDYLLKMYEESEINLYGRALGTGIASYLASSNSPKQLILETPYYNIADVAKDRFPFFPVEKLLKYKFPTNEYLTNTSCPITIFHGTDDNVVPYASAQKLIELELANLKAITIKHGEHNNLADFDSYHKALTELLE